METRSTTEAMSAKAQILDEAVTERDIPMARSAIRAQKSKMAVASLVLEAMCHIDRISDDRDWEWLYENV